MAENENTHAEHAVQVSFKLGRLADLVNLRADSVEDMKGVVAEWSEANALITSLIQTAQAEAIIMDKDNFPETERISEPASSGGVKLCAHNQPYVTRSGNKGGKAWSAQFCTVKGDPRLPECEPIWSR